MGKLTDGQAHIGCWENREGKEVSVSEWLSLITENFEKNASVIMQYKRKVPTMNDFQEAMKILDKYNKMSNLEKYLQKRGIELIYGGGEHPVVVASKKKQNISKRLIERINARKFTR